MPPISKTEVAIIGSGPGGYVAGIRLGQLGKKAIVVEKDEVGGVCLNVGCIPSKALITASKLVKNARTASRMGIDAELTVDLQRLQEWKQSVVSKLTGGVSSLLKAYKVPVLRGTASLVSKNELQLVDGDESVSRIQFDYAVLATGSSSVELPNLKFDGKRIISSTEALSLKSPPKSMLIVGGGVIGLEIGMAYANLFGTQLTIVELLDQLLPGVNLELVNQVVRSLQRMGAKIHLKSRVKLGVVSSDKVKVTFETPDGTELSEEIEYVLVSVGRKPNSKGIGLEAAGIETDQKGFVKVDKQMRTNVPNIYAIGDLVGLPLLAHKASREAIVAAEVISGIKSSFDNVAIPAAIFTDPEIAVVGLSEAEAAARGLKTRVGKFPFAANGRALASLESEGFSKVITDSETGLLLGLEIVGQEASDLVSEGTLALEMGATAEDIALTIHPHPTLPETIMEAAENSLGKAIHIQNRPPRS